MVSCAWLGWASCGLASMVLHGFELFSFYRDLVLLCFFGWVGQVSRLLGFELGFDKKNDFKKS